MFDSLFVVELFIILMSLFFMFVVGFFRIC